MSKKRYKPAPTAPAKKHTTVCVAFLHNGTTSAFFTTSTLGLLLHDQNADRHITALKNEWSSANISASRNNLTRKFLDETSCDYMLFIDSDMAFEPIALDELLAVADPITTPIVGGLCFGMADSKLFPTIYNAAIVDGTPTLVRSGDYPDDSLLQCDATGAAFLMFHRDVAKQMRDREFNKSFPWFQEMEMSGQPLGEDMTFCLRAGQCGFPVFVHTGVHVGHHKTQLLTHDLFRAQQEAAKAEESV